MKSLGIKGLVLLVLVLALSTAVPALAAPPTEASGYAEAFNWYVDPDGNLVAEVAWTGTFEGTLTHTLTDGRADAAVFEGCVAGACGTLDMLILTTWGDPLIPGYRGKWVIRGGSDGLENLHGRGTFFLDNYDPVGGPYEGKIRFSGDE